MADFNDVKYQALRAMGYMGTLNEMEMAFYTSLATGGGIAISQVSGLQAALNNSLTANKAAVITSNTNNAAQVVATIPMVADQMKYVEITTLLKDDSGAAASHTRQVRIKKIGASSPLIVGTVNTIGADANDGTLAGLVPVISVSSANATTMNIILTNPASGSVVLNGSVSYVAITT